LGWLRAGASKARKAIGGRFVLTGGRMSAARGVLTVFLFRRKMAKKNPQPANNPLNIVITSVKNVPRQFLRQKQRVDLEESAFAVKIRKI
jgi:hypothetical protein